MFHGVSTAEAIKGTLQFVGSKRPISAPRGDPQSDMTGLNRSYHEIANTRKLIVFKVSEASHRADVACVNSDRHKHPEIAGARRIRT